MEDLFYLFSILRTDSSKESSLLVLSHKILWNSMIFFCKFLLIYFYLRIFFLISSKSSSFLDPFPESNVFKYPLIQAIKFAWSIEDYYSSYVLFFMTLIGDDLLSLVSLCKVFKLFLLFLRVCSTFELCCSCCCCCWVSFFMLMFLGLYIIKWNSLKFVFWFFIKKNYQYISVEIMEEMKRALVNIISYLRSW